MTGPVQDHLEPDTVAAFVEQRLSRDARDAAERHLAECAMCRREVAQVVRVLRPRLPQWTRPAILAAAAVLVVAAIGLWRGAETPSALRGGDSGTSIAVTGPDSVVSVSEGVTFAWHGVAPDARYEFTLADESGMLIFSTGSSDTVVTLPDSVRLQGGRTYQWFVDALRPDGRSMTSGVRFIRITP